MKTNKTIKQMFLAASVAMTMGVAGATSVPGIGTDVFEFTKPNVDPNAFVVGTGVDAIANMNAILAAVGGTGGSSLNEDNFWGSSVAKNKVDVFEYDAAAPMIEELIFLVKGQAYDPSDQSYKEAGSVATYTYNNGIVATTSDAKTDFLARATNSSGGGNYLDGKLSHTKQMAIDLMEMLKFTATDKPLNWKTNNTLQASTDTNNPTDNPENHPVVFTGPHQAIDITDVTGGTYTTNLDESVTYNNDSNVEVATKCCES